MRKLTTFEKGAHDIQYRKKFGQEHPHVIETYTSGGGDRLSLKKEYIFIAIVMAVTVTILVLDYTGLTVKFISLFE